MIEFYNLRNKEIYLYWTIALLVTAQFLCIFLPLVLKPLKIKNEFLNISEVTILSNQNYVNNIKFCVKIVEENFFITYCGLYGITNIIPKDCVRFPDNFNELLNALSGFSDFKIIFTKLFYSYNI